MSSGAGLPGRDPSVRAEVVHESERTRPAIAGQLAVSLDNTQLYAEFRRIAGEQAALRRVATLVAQGARPEQVFAAVAEEAGRLLVADFAVLVRYDGPQEAITIIGTWTGTGAPAPTPVGGQLPLGGQNVTTLVYRTGQPARIDYDDAISGAIGQVATQDWGLRSSVGVPISIEGRLWGVMVVAFTHDELLPADTEAQLAGFTELVATAVANAQARGELRGFAGEQAALRRVATLVARAVPPEEVFAAITAEAGRLLTADLAVLSRYDPDGTEILLGAWAGTGAPPVAVGTRVALGGAIRVVAGVPDEPAGADRKLRRRYRADRHPRPRARRPGVGRRADQRGGPAVGRHDDGHPLRAAAGGHRGAAGRVHRAGRHRGRQRAGPGRGGRFPGADRGRRRCRPPPDPAQSARRRPAAAGHAQPGAARGAGGGAAGSR